jgi:hypothetical protein
MHALYDHVSGNCVAFLQQEIPAGAEIEENRQIVKENPDFVEYAS